MLQVYLHSITHVFRKKIYPTGQTAIDYARVVSFQYIPRKLGLTHQFPHADQFPLCWIQWAAGIPVDKELLLVLAAHHRQ